jgi:hypothetical protein
MKFSIWEQLKTSAANTNREMFIQRGVIKFYGLFRTSPWEEVKPNLDLGGELIPLK